MSRHIEMVVNISIEFSKRILHACMQHPTIKLACPFRNGKREPREKKNIHRICGCLKSFVLSIFLSSSSFSFACKFHSISITSHSRAYNTENIIHTSRAWHQQITPCSAAHTAHTHGCTLQQLVSDGSSMLTVWALFQTKAIPF